MQKFNSRNHIGPAAFIICMIAVVVWLINGSSNQPKQQNWRSGWQTTTTFNIARRAMAAVAYNNHLYIVGGIDGNDHYIRNVEFAPILENGTLGPWQQTSPLIEGRFYNTVIAANGYLYAIGGGSGQRGKDNYPIASIERAHINKDGSLGPWQLHSHLNTPRRGLKTVLHNNTIYAIGGYNGEFLKSTEHAKLSPDGDLGEWHTERSESTIDRYIHSAALHKNSIYLLGGHMRNPNRTSYSDVEQNHIDASGNLGSWQPTAFGLQTSRLIAEAFSLGDYLYIAGGHNGNERLTSVEFTHITTQNQIVKWQPTSALPTPLSAFATATHNDYIYALGGSGADGPLNTAYSATLNHQGQLGHWQTLNY